MALDSYNQIRQEVFDMSLEGVVHDYIGTEMKLAVVDDLEEDLWLSLTNRIELLEERLWTVEKHQEWIPIYLQSIPKDILDTKITRYSNYIHRLGHCKDKEAQMRRTVARYRLFLSYVTGHHSYLQQ